MQCAKCAKTFEWMEFKLRTPKLHSSTVCHDEACGGPLVDRWYGPYLSKDECAKLLAIQDPKERWAANRALK